MKIGSLCSGYGGIDLAVEQFYGATTAWHCEYETAPSKILAHHWDVPNHHDLTILDWDAVEPVDIITGGYPCQPFSAAGQRKGADDERHLWPYVRQAIRHLRPRLALLENVAGHRSLGFDRVLGDCAEDGLHVRWVSLRASDAGAPHGRDRVFFIVEDPDRATRYQRGQSAPGQAEGGRSWSDAGRRGGAPTADPRGHGLCGYAEPVADANRGERDGREQNQERGAVERTTATGSGGIDWGSYEPAIRRWESTLGRPAPAPTEPGRNGPRLSPLLVEWMMGLPAGWVTDPAIGLTRNEQLKALGNGVVPQQALAALELLSDVGVAA